MSLLQEILNWDRKLFQEINGQWTNSFFDGVLPYTRNAIIWVPLYLYFIVFTALNYKRKGFFWIFKDAFVLSCMKAVGLKPPG